MSKNYRTTIRLPKQIRQEMHEAMVRNGYGLRSKSQWIGEAIEQLVEFDDFQELVDIAENMANLTESEVVYLSPKIKDTLDDALIQVRKHFPTLEGVQSNIIRTSIMQRLFRL